jgi:hypothetical protein
VPSSSLLSRLDRTCRAYGGHPSKSWLGSMLLNFGDIIRAGINLRVKFEVRHVVVRPQTN